MTPGKFLKEPLLHFLLIGALLFGIGAIKGESASTDPVRRIAIDSGQVINLIEGWRRTWQRPPTEQELQGLVEDFVKEEIYYREAMALGLDRDDAIIRRRLRQKIEFLSEDLSGTIDPTDAELQTFLSENVDSYRLDATFTLAHRYFNVDRRGAEAFDQAESAIDRLDGVGGGDQAQLVGDPLPLPMFFENAPERDLSTAFGPEFAQAVHASEVGSWQGPIRSGFGYHVIFVAERTERRVPTLDEVRFAVERDWRFAKQNEVGERLFQGLRDRYDITVEWPEALSAMEGR